MQSSFIEFIKAITEVPAEQESKFYNLVSVRSLKRGEDFMKAGGLSKTIAFNTDGLFRYYYTSPDGVEFTKGFFPEHSVLSSYSAILENRPSYFTIEALEDSTIEVVDYPKWMNLFSEHPCWNELLVALLQKAFRVKEEREREFLLFNAEQRYKAFLKRYPQLEKRVKQHIIASYLGITPESLSRIRKNIILLT